MILDSSHMDHFQIISSTNRSIIFFHLYQNLSVSFDFPWSTALFHFDSIFLEDPIRRCFMLE